MIKIVSKILFVAVLVYLLMAMVNGSFNTNDWDKESRAIAAFVVSGFALAIGILDYLNNANK